MANTTYEGWRNRATWNVALWILNDEMMYRSAVAFMEQYKGKTPYLAFIHRLGLNGSRTPDRILWDGRGLGYGELNEMMRELNS